jgi:hypothetical protein
MRKSTRFKTLVGVLALPAVVLAAGAAGAGELGSAVIERLGQVVATPEPSPEPEERIRLISSLTIQNKPTGESIITFEAADFGEKKNDQYRIIAIEQYSLIEPKRDARQMRDDIVAKIRDLERDLLEYVEIVGPPREPQKIFETGGAGSSQY